MSQNRDPRYVTFVNPALCKGAYPFVRIAQELGRRRPDIPLLVVESRATRMTLGACGLRPSDHPHIQIMPVTTDPRRFWRLTKVLLMPSLWWENQPLVAVEAMINGIPVIGSDRGGIPETLGDGGIALSLPERLTPLTQILPTAEEVEPWVEAIIRLWDDPAWYQEQSARGSEQAQRWHPDRLRPLYAEFFGKVRLQPRPPLVVTPLASLPSDDHAPRAQAETIALSFVACVSDDEIVKANVLSSPCLHQGCPHEFTVVKNCPSAAGGLNRGLERARHEWVVCLHQDVVLPAGWDRCLVPPAPRGRATVRADRCRGSLWGRRGDSAAETGRGVRGRADRLGRRSRPNAPRRARAARPGRDPRRAAAGRAARCGPAIRPGAGISSLWGRSLPSGAGKGPGRRGARGPLSSQLAERRAAGGVLSRAPACFARKWEHRLPIATPCAIIDHGGRVHVLGNATDGPGSIAYASSGHGRGPDKTMTRRKAGKVLAADSESGER